MGYTRTWGYREDDDIPSIFGAFSWILKETQQKSSLCLSFPAPAHELVALAQAPGEKWAVGSFHIVRLVYIILKIYRYDHMCIHIHIYMIRNVYIYILDRVYLYIYYCHSCAILTHFCLIIGFHACESSSFGTDPGRSTESSLSHRRSINWGLHVYEIQHHVSQHIPPPAHCLSGDDGDLARSRCGPHTNGYKRDDFHSTITNFSWFQHHKSSAG